MPKNGNSQLKPSPRSVHSRISSASVCNLTDSNSIWDIAPPGVSLELADWSADHFQRRGRPLRVAIDVHCWQVFFENDSKVDWLRKSLLPWASITRFWQSKLLTFNSTRLSRGQCGRENDHVSDYDLAGAEHTPCLRL